jgi:hypothetical protein
MPPLLHNLGMLRNDVLVAIETKVHGRDSGIVRSFHKRMTEPAVDLLDPRVHPVAEIDRLNRTDPLMGVKIIKIKKTGEEKDYDAEENESPDGSAAFLGHIIHNPPPLLLFEKEDRKRGGEEIFAKRK